MAFRLLRLRARGLSTDPQIASGIAQLRQARSRRWAAWKAVPVGRQIEIRAAAVLLAALVVLGTRAYFTGSPIGVPSSSGPPALSIPAGSLGGVTDQVRAKARDWQSDAELVQIEVSDFGFAAGPSGIPDMTKAGPPGVATFHFISPSAHQAIRIIARLNLTAEQSEFMASQGVGPIQVEHLATPYSAYTLPIPDSSIDAQRAIAQAQNDIGPECLGRSLEARSCGLVSGAELHVFWSGQGETGSPVWTISFGQNPRTLQTVTREVDALAGGVVALVDRQRGTINPEPNQQLQSIVLANIGSDFDSVWRAVNQTMVKQDALYKPYAISLIAYLRDNPRSDAAIDLSEAEFQYARITPSFNWDDRTLHVKWTGSAAILDISPSVPRHAPEEPVPRTLEAQNLPIEDPTLRKILNVFPPGYIEQYTAWERGCQNMMTVSPWIKQWECGVLVPTVHRTDQVYIWMTRHGNPYWESAAAPLQSEHTLISNSAPDTWVWWTRLKRANQWQYVIVNAASGVPATTAGLCTVAPEGNDARPAAIEACR